MRHLCVVLLFTSVLLRAADAPPADPVSLGAMVPLSAENAAKAREFFAQLGAPEFANRQSALTALLAMGPAVLPLAGEFKDHANLDVRSQAARLEGRMLVREEYWPLSAELHAALQRDLAFDTNLYNGKDVKDVLTAAGKQAGIRIELDSQFDLPDFPFTRNADQFGAVYSNSARSVLEKICENSPLAVVPRGNLVLLTLNPVAEKLRLQSTLIPWEFSDADAQRAAKMLAPFFPKDMELSATPKGLQIRGPVAALQRGQRIGALLTGALPAGPWPLATTRGPVRDAEALEQDAAALSKDLAEPLSIEFPGEDVLSSLNRFGTRQITVQVQEGPSVNASAAQIRLRTGTLVNLRVSEMPLGLVFRWIEEQGKFITLDNEDATLAIEPLPQKPYIARVFSSADQPLRHALAGADVAFLKAADDEAAAKQLFGALMPELALYYAIQKDDMVVIRNRVIIQGPALALARALALLRAWQASGQPPNDPWRAAFEKRLDTPIAWEPQVNTNTDPKPMQRYGNLVLMRLRALTKLPIYMNGPLFPINETDAALLPRGQQAPRALLDDLAKRAKVRWSAKHGAVLLEAPEGAPAP